MKRLSMSAALCAAGAGLALAPAVSAQSLFQIPPAVAPEQANVDPAAALYEMSLIAIKPPEPRQFAVNDLVTIVVRESLDVQRDHKLEAEKEYDLDTARIQWWELAKFLALNGNPADVSNLAEFSVGHTSDFKGDAKYERTDRITGRLTARVLDIKPNGQLLLEARSVIQTDREKQTYLLSGYCRTEDVTESNTVESNQLFDLRYEVHNEGEMADVNKKGIFPKVLETIFNF
ncbi:MAG: flagellar basal body L-ring protein FlgH [Planctomycetota bacterium]|nr:flagellar basal body L-ring protein FlgH [Planctomycetota bacterium]